MPSWVEAATTAAAPGAAPQTASQPPPLGSYAAMARRPPSAPGSGGGNGGGGGGGGRPGSAAHGVPALNLERLGVVQEGVAAAGAKHADRRAEPGGAHAACATGAPIGSSSVFARLYAPSGASARGKQHGDGGSGAHTARAPLQESNRHAAREPVHASSLGVGRPHTARSARVTMPAGAKRPVTAAVGGAQLDGAAVDGAHSRRAAPVARSNAWV